MGILSSHPAAIIATMMACGQGLSEFSLDTTKKLAKHVMASCPVQYVRKAKLRGRLFQPGAQAGVVCCADTNFFVDHMEPMKVLAAVKDRLVWPFGDLPEGYEFLALVP